MKTNTTEDELEELEIDLLLEGMVRHLGYDFRDYAPDSRRRRIRKAMSDEGLASITSLLDRALHDPACMARLVATLTINVTTMFRDPSFYLAFRRKVVPRLKTWPFVKIWHAGCSSGEEVYSTAIVLAEEGLYERCRIYATDINEPVLSKARAGIYPLKVMQEYTKNYLQAGGKDAFSGYYTAHYDNALLCADLRENIVFAVHNLATDGPFNEFQLVLCRNVLIFFDKPLQRRAHDLFHQSLSMFGILALGRSESISKTGREDCYEPLVPEEKIYRRVA